jgi:isoamylase
VWWFRADGRRMTKRDWNEQRTIGMFLNGQEIAAPGPRGERVEDDSFLMLFNAYHEDVGFTLPTRRFGFRWALELSSAEPDAERFEVDARREVSVTARSVVLLKRIA